MRSNLPVAFKKILIAYCFSRPTCDYAIVRLQKKKMERRNLQSAKIVVLKIIRVVLGDLKYEILMVKDRILLNS